MKELCPECGAPQDSFLDVREITRILQWHEYIAETNPYFFTDEDDPIAHALLAQKLMEKVKPSAKSPTDG